MTEPRTRAKRNVIESGVAPTEQVTDAQPSLADVVPEAPEAEHVNGAEPTPLFDAVVAEQPEDPQPDPRESMPTSARLSTEEFISIKRLAKAIDDGQAKTKALREEADLIDTLAQGAQRNLSTGISQLITQYGLRPGVYRVDLESGILVNEPRAG